MLERASIKPVSEEVKHRRWNMIGHILRQDRNDVSNIAISWAPEGKRIRGRPCLPRGGYVTGFSSWRFDSGKIFNNYPAKSGRILPDT